MKKIGILCERETDGRWIAEAEGFPGVLAYGASKDEAFQAAAALCLRVILDRMQHGEAPSAPIVDMLFTGAWWSTRRSIVGAASAPRGRSAAV